MKFFSILPVVLATFAVSATPVAHESICKGAKVVSESFIGKDKNVKVTSLSCQELVKGTPQNDVLLNRGTLASQVNVCGANCSTNCFTPSGGGPNPNECHIIADALRYESQHTGAIFQVQNGTVTGNPLVMQYASCKTFFVNQDLGPLEYCRTDWADLVDYLSLNCQAQQNAHGGNCVAKDQRWFVQVQTA